MGNAAAVRGRTSTRKCCAPSSGSGGFLGAWCGPCRAIAPPIEEIAREYDGKLKWSSSTPTRARTSRSVPVLSIPTLMLFKGGKVVERVIGAMRRRFCSRRSRPPGGLSGADAAPSGPPP